MASASTYVPIANQVLTSATASVTFSSIPSTYTDLVLVSSAGYSTGGGNGTINLQFNGDTGTNYSFTYIQGNGSAASSGRGSSTTIGVAAQADGSNLGSFAANTCQIMNYSNTTTYKIAITRANADTVATQAWVSLWRSTSAITSLTLTGAYSMAIGSTFTLYGILAA